MKNTYSSQTQNKKIEELHYELQDWKSNLHFIKDEIKFINQLLNSYVFQPNTPNLFERLQDYQHRLKKIKKSKTELQKAIAQHENNLGGMIECTDEYCDLQYYKKHDTLKTKIVDSIIRFKDLKSEIFNYAGGILKKRKPVSDN
ncbi:hypothetical protein [uncultured Croceitalea sp.]|uniref:hypothetical protein n=1 Tax=uncultured Croceitalea sp. TaxID=1798908 RepID=UPI00374FB995